VGGGWGIFLGSLAGMAALMFAENWLRGPICDCRLQTAAQVELLPSLSRLPTALKAWSRLRIRIEAVQGKLTPEFFQSQTSPQTQADSRSSGGVVGPPASIAPGATQAGEGLGRSSGTAHAVLFTFLTLDAVLSAVDINMNHIALTLAGLVVNLGVTASAVSALIQQTQTNIGRFLRWHVLASLGYVCVLFLLGAAYSFRLSLENRQRIGTQWDTLVAISNTSAWQSPWLMSIGLFCIVTCLAIAVPGWFALARFWAQPSTRLSGRNQGSALPI
jgi:hypothetical protein